MHSALRMVIKYPEVSTGAFRDCLMECLASETSSTSTSVPWESGCTRHCALGGKALVRRGDGDDDEDIQAHFHS